MNQAFHFPYDWVLKNINCRQKKIFGGRRSSLLPPSFWLKAAIRSFVCVVTVSQSRQETLSEVSACLRFIPNCLREYWHAKVTEPTVMLQSDATFKYDSGCPILLNAFSSPPPPLASREGETEMRGDVRRGEERRGNEERRQGCTTWEIKRKKKFSELLLSPTYGGDSYIF